MDESQIQFNRRNNEEESTRMRARVLGFPYLDTRNFEQNIPLVEELLDVDQMHRDYILPLQKGGGAEHYQFMITAQTPKSVIADIRREYEEQGERADFFLISGSAYKAFMLRYDPPVETVYDDIEIAKEGDSETIESVSKTLNEVSTDKVFDFLLDQADKLGASDIHIENMRDKIRIRMRVDGILHPVADINRDRYRIFMGELSFRAGISTAAKTAQSGHMQKDIERDGKSHLLNIRVETVPTMYGQDAVLRLFNFDETLLNLDLLGLSEDERAEIDEVISHPRGLVLMVGPTGSGKSTTLYSILNALNSTDRKIITLEDPIEYGITGITQIPIDTTSGQEFADGLRSVLRLDPDVVMVGEIRDTDTARTAIQASITGHLVLSSFHANSTSAAFSRMIDMIGQNPIFSSSVRLVMAQRLVRKLAENKEMYRPDEPTRRYIEKVFEGVPEKVMRDHNIDLNDITLCRPVISDQYPFGYKGRTVIMEQMVVTDEIASFIRGDVKDINTKTIEDTARASGLLTLEQKGVLAALRGETTLEEVARVI
ncbi:Flp pilus assembly complex ATPase component TadA [Candidatus Saccharibacteria bacterium]|nr:Flp pilus assembly complex ATPase component TadA [Candidatus Saccharibacteria bacterium]